MGVINSVTGNPSNYMQEKYATRPEVDAAVTSAKDLARQLGHQTNERVTFISDRLSKHVERLTVAVVFLGAGWLTTTILLVFGGHA